MLIFLQKKSIENEKNNDVSPYVSAGGPVMGTTGDRG